MKTWHTGYILLALAGLLLLAGCSSTWVVTSWSDDPNRSSGFRKPLVVAIANKQIIRKKFEDEFVRDLRTMGLDAVQSYRMFPEEDLKPDTIKAKLADTDRDSVLVMRLVDVKKETVDVPARTDMYSSGGGYSGVGYYNSGFDSYYARSYSTVTSPGYSYDFRVFVLETNLYDAGTRKLAGSVVTETHEPDSIDTAIKEFVREVLKSFRKYRLL